MCFTVKGHCIYMPCEPPGFCLGGKQPDWSGHPSWIGAIEALDSYNRWVDMVVLPIAFQWIEEHKQDVYATVKKADFDDVGVVIASAFKLVKQMPAYKAGLKEFEKFESALENKTFNPKSTNPVWTKTVKRVRAATRKAFAEETRPRKRNAASVTR